MNNAWRVQIAAFGFALWAVGTAAIAGFGRAPVFPTVVAPLALVAAPLAAGAAWVWLRRLPDSTRYVAGLEFGVIVTAVQFPLDAVGWPVLQRAGLLPTNTNSLFVALEIGYLCLLVVPVLVGSRRPRTG
ncbi:MAG: hypothetical protein HY876_01205 [Coriobacteriales bacterium]|nr:hypothetical protein [Coriobacteriales bacterium]